MERCHDKAGFGSSLAGIRASVTGGSVYSASKHGVVGMTRAARTPLSEGILGDGLEAMGSSHPLNRICEAEEVASAVYWLSSHDASFVTGIAMPVDGGTQA